MNARRFLPALLLILQFLAPCSARAMVCWGTNGGRVAANALGGAVPDGEQGALLFFIDDSLRALRLDRDGCRVAGWPDSGIAINAALGSSFPDGWRSRLIGTIPDGSGDALLEWAEGFCCGVACFGTCFEYHLQRFTASGQVAPCWPDTGAVLPDYVARWKGPSIPDGSGGAYVGWQNHSAYGRVLRLACGGIVSGWPSEGRCFDDSCEMPSYCQSFVQDGAGGVLMFGQSANPTRLIGQRFDAGGTRQWSDGGVTVSTPYEVGNVASVSDGAGGAIVVWEGRQQTDPAPARLYAQHVTSSGSLDPAWPPDGAPLLEAASESAYGAVKVVSDGVGGAIAAWADVRNSQDSGLDLYAQRITSSGVVWAPGGRVVCQAPGDQTNYPISVAPDGTGGAYIAWTDPRSGWRMYAMRITADGLLGPGWPADGRAVSPVEQAGGWIGNPTVIRSEDGAGVIAFWGYYGNAAPIAVYAAKLRNGALVDVPTAPSETSSLRLTSPNPSMERFHFELRVPRASSIDASIVDVTGRRIRTLIASVLGDGVHRLSWDGLSGSGSPAPSGIYFLRVETVGEVRTRACVLLR